MLPYSMSKAALQLCSDQGAGHGIGQRRNHHVNLVAPGYFDTWHNRAGVMTDPEVKAERRLCRYAPPHRLRRRTRECGGVTLFGFLQRLPDDTCTGQTIYVDGGMSAR